MLLRGDDDVCVVMACIIATMRNSFLLLLLLLCACGVCNVCVFFCGGEPCCAKEREEGERERGHVRYYRGAQRRREARAASRSAEWMHDICTLCAISWVIMQRWKKVFHWRDVCVCVWR